MGNKSIQSLKYETIKWHIDTFLMSGKTSNDFLKWIDPSSKDNWNQAESKKNQTIYKLVRSNDYQLSLSIFFVACGLTRGIILKQDASLIHKLTCCDIRNFNSDIYITKFGNNDQNIPIGDEMYFMINEEKKFIKTPKDLIKMKIFVYLTNSVVMPCYYLFPNTKEWHTIAIQRLYEIKHCLESVRDMNIKALVAEFFLGGNYHFGFECVNWNFSQKDEIGSEFYDIYTFENIFKNRVVQTHIPPKSISDDLMNTKFIIEESLHSLDAKKEFIRTSDYEDEECNIYALDDVDIIEGNYQLYGNGKFFL